MKLWDKIRQLRIEHANEGRFWCPYKIDDFMKKISKLLSSEVLRSKKKTYTEPDHSHKYTLALIKITYFMAPDLLSKTKLIILLSPWSFTHTVYTTSFCIIKKVSELSKADRYSCMIDLKNPQKWHVLFVIIRKQYDSFSLALAHA